MKATISQVKTSKYQGWTIEKHVEGEKVSYFMIRNAGIYAIDIMVDSKGNWDGEIMTRQKHFGDRTPGWYPARNSLCGTVAQCVAEAERRAAWIAANAK